MTHDELFDKIKEYESKWGKLGHTSILHPERQAINHSGIDSENNTNTNKNNTNAEATTNQVANTILQKGSKIMNKFTNDFYEFRRKVAQGREKNAIAHTGLINVDELNERNLRNQFEKNTLIHAGTNNKDHKYFMKEEIGGKPRYFYSKEEWDAWNNAKDTAKKTGNIAGKFINSVADDIKKERTKNTTEATNARENAIRNGVKAEQERQRDAENRRDALDNYNNNAKAESINKIIEVSKNGGSEAAAQAFTDTSDYKLYMEMISKMVDQGYDPRKDSPEVMGKDYAQAIKDAEDNMQEYFDAVPGLSQSAKKYALGDLEDMINKKKGIGSGVMQSLDSDKLMAKNIDNSVAEKIKHSSDDDGVMSEYRAFKNRANRGAMQNRLVHSSIISVNDLNARYEEELRKQYIAIHPESEDDLEHASRDDAEYYNKIEDYYGKGRHRYFYTKAEWDAYQDGLGQAKYREHQNTVNQMKKESAERAAQAQKIADQKQEASNRANMGGYEEYQKNKAEKEKAAENEKKKDYASQKSGMTGYNKYQENLKANQEADARQKDIDTKKEVSAQKSGMTDYNKYQENLKADQEADRREKQKVEASQRSGMEGYNDYQKYKSAKDEADRRNDAEGLEKFQAKKKAEEDLKKQRAETVAKNKAADEAKKASEDEQHREEKNARLTAEKEAKEAKDAKIAELTDQLNKIRSGNAKEATSSREAAEAAGRKTEYDRLNDARDAEHESDKETRKMREKYAAAGEKATNILDNTLKPYNNKLKDLNDKYDNLKDKSSPEAKTIKSQISSIETERDNKFDKVYNELMDEMDAEYNKLLKSGNKTEAAELNSMRNAVKSAYEASPEEIKEMFPLYYNVTHTTASTAGDGKKGHKF